MKVDEKISTTTTSERIHCARGGQRFRCCVASSGEADANFLLLWVGRAVFDETHVSSMVAVPVSGEKKNAISQRTPPRVLRLRMSQQMHQFRTLPTFRNTNEWTNDPTKMKKHWTQETFTEEPKGGGDVVGHRARARLIWFFAQEQLSTTTLLALASDAWSKSSPFKSQTLSAHFVWGSFWTGEISNTHIHYSHSIWVK